MKSPLNYQFSNLRNFRAFSLVEVLVIIGVIGVISAIALPTVSRIFDSANDAKDRMNAKQMEQMSGTLASLGVAHVMPESLGGVPATARLLREGVIVPEGPMAGEKFIMSALQDDDIESLEDYLKVRYDMRELSLQYFEVAAKNKSLEAIEVVPEF